MRFDLYTMGAEVKDSPRRIAVSMDLTPFKLDIDELINEFAECHLTTLADMKRIWLSRKFTFIYEAKPTTNLAFFIQSLFSHSIGHMLSTTSLSQRLGGLYCLYCLHETQPLKPPFKIYLSLGELKKLKDLVIEAKDVGIKVLPVLIKKMLEKNMFLFGSVEINDNSVDERVNEITSLQNARMQAAYERLLAKYPTDRFLQMDLGAQLDLEALKRMSKEYAAAKEQAISEAGKMVDIQNIKHIAENKKSLGDLMEKVVEDWNYQKEIFHQQTGSNQQSRGQGNEVVCYQDDDSNNPLDVEEADEFGKELELLLA